MAEVKITSNRELARWLLNKPVDWARVIAVRAALRAVPLATAIKRKRDAEFEFGMFRLALLSWAACNVPSLNLADALYPGIVNVTHRKPRPEFFDTFVYAARSLGDDDVPDAWASAAPTAFISPFFPLFVSNNQSSYWWLVAQDCRWLEEYRQLDNPARVLSRRSLWLGRPAVWWIRQWDASVKILTDMDHDYAVWTDWFERRIRGERAAFDIPGDKYRKEDKAILRRLAKATDKDFWDKGHEYVNAELTRWLEEARARAASQVQPEPSALPQDPEQIAAALLRQASPQALITEGKLDAGPNALFDQPQYSDDLAELPSELLAFTGVILNSLPRNCEAVVRHCFAAFRDELLARGNRPIVNILKAMAASLIAELYGAEQAPLSPDLRELKDPREWGDGMAAMFAQFFRGYHDLIHHFPLDPEREALIAATPIDEAAASGAALTEPVDTVAALILELGKQGFATDNIVRIIEAHQLYNRDVSQLPTPGQANQTVTPKRRHVLSTAGFYLHTYSVLGSTASIYALQTVPAVQALMLQLERAANALLAFVR